MRQEQQIPCLAMLPSPRWILALIFICFGLPIDGGSVVGASTFYVSASVGTNGDGSSPFPWKGLSNIDWDKVNAGDTILVGAGTYSAGLEVKKSGVAGAPISIKAMGNALITGQAVNGAGIWLGGCRHVRIEGFEITGVSFGIHLGWTSEVTNIELVNNTIHDSGWNSTDTAGIYFYPGYASNLLIEGNHIYQVGGDGIQGTAAGGLVLRNNHIHDTRVDGFKGGGKGLVIIEGNNIHNGGYRDAIGTHPDGIQFMGGADTLIIRGNTIHSYTSQLMLDTYCEYNHDNNSNTPNVRCAVSWDKVFIHNNLIFTTVFQSNGLEGWQNGILFELRWNPINEINVFNNTLVDLNDGYGGIGSTQAPYGGIGKLRIKNNIFYNSFYLGAVASSLEQDYNAYFNEHRNWSLPGYRNLERYQIDYPQYEQHGIEVHPQFESYAARSPSSKFHLQPTSPLIDQGDALAPLSTNLATIEFDFDKELNDRPQGLRWDIGAYEYVGSPQSRPDDITDVTSSGPDRFLRFANVLSRQKPLAIRFHLTQAKQATVAVFTRDGGQVKELFNGQGSKGDNTVHWDGRISKPPTPESANEEFLAAGVYILRLETPNGKDTTKVVIVK